MRNRLLIPIFAVTFLFGSVILSRTGTAQNEPIAFQSEDPMTTSTPSSLSPTPQSNLTPTPSPTTYLPRRQAGNPQLTTFSPTSVPRIGEPASEANHIELEVSADPAQYQGSCKNPLEITFTATITVEKPGSVQYLWVQSEETKPSGPQWITFDQAGTKTISSDWQIPVEKLVNLDFSGWKKMKILSPVVVESNAASFSILCSL